MYSYKYRIPFSMVDGNNEITIPSIMTLFQDVAIFHSTDLGVSAEVLKERNLGWVVVSWQVEILRKPKGYETVIVGTAPTLFKSVVAERNLYIKDLDGNVLVRANSFWCMMNFNTRSLAAIPKDVVEKYQVAPKMEMNYKPRNIILPKGEKEEFDPIPVDDNMIDFMGHVNNVMYIRLALAKMKEQESITSFRVEYKTQALPGDYIYPVKWVLDDQIVVTLKNKEGNVFSTISVDR